MRLMTEEQFEIAFQRFNALNGQGGRWEKPTARKNHDDLFGDLIARGERYFRKLEGPAVDQVVKVSRRSMEQMLYAVINNMPLLRQLGDVMLEKEREEMRKIAEEMDAARIRAKRS